MKLAVFFRVVYLAYLFKRSGVYRFCKSTAAAPIYYLCKALFFIPSLKLSDGKALVYFFEKAGTIAIKLGQMLSTQSNLFEPELLQEIINLQTKVAPIAYQEALALIYQDFKKHNIDYQAYQLTIAETPLASASIAQVHSATAVIDGQLQELAIKFVRPNIKQQIDLDLKIIKSISYWINDKYPESSKLHLQELIEQLDKILYQEIDLDQEGKNLQRFYDIWHNSGQILVPKFYPQLSSRNTMVMERVFGDNLYQVVKQPDVDFKYLANLGVELFFKQVLVDNYYHADMHPGNIMFNIDNPQQPFYISLDFGNMGSLMPEDKKYLAENLLAFFSRDYRKVAQLHIDSGWSRGQVDIDKFELAIAQALDKIFNKTLSEFSFSELLSELFKVARSFNMEVQPGLVLLQRTLVYIEGMGRTLYQDLNLWETAKPHVEAWVKQQYSIEPGARAIKDNLGLILQTIAKTPDLYYQYQNSFNQIHFMLEQQQIKNYNNFNKLKSLVYWIINFNLLIILLIGIKLSFGWLNFVSAGLLIIMLMISLARLII